MKEGSARFPYQIYCDMDGVLVDFENGAIKQINQDLKNKSLHGKELDELRMALSDLGRDTVTLEDLSKMDKERRLQPARDYMYVRLSNDEEFWANLPWMSGGKELWNHISQFNPHILTAPMRGVGSKNGKKLWIKENLTPGPQNIHMSHEKYNWAVDESGQPNVLIDDFTSNTVPWRESGGVAILHTDVKKTIEQLRELINNIPAERGRV